MTRQPALSFLQRSGMVLMGSPFTMKKGMFNASSLGCISFSPLSMKPNCRAPATRYSGTCREQLKRMYVDSTQTYTGVGTGSTRQLGMGAAAMHKAEPMSKC